ncbi:MAG: ImmA/IrrE family metallo-endopeptidase [Rhizobium sp.]|nr:ImmA/IrrE family metallo-endopeptidase [Rhizobium sp.]
MNEFDRQKPQLSRIEGEFNGKGDELEDHLYQFLLDQQRRGELIYGLSHPNNSKIFKKKKYFCKERKNKIEFDVVVETYQPGSSQPSYYTVLECKNYRSALPDEKVRSFSDKLSSVFRHNAKGVMVVRNAIQSGAENIIRERGLGLAKYNPMGLDLVIARIGIIASDRELISSNIFTGESRSRHLKFSGLYDGVCFASLGHLLGKMHGSFCEEISSLRNSVPFLSSASIAEVAASVASSTGYVSGPSNLERVCEHLSLSLHYSGRILLDDYGREILGRANFSSKSVEIYRHGDPNRMRFTLAHEIGHFCLNHSEFIHAESVIETDIDSVDDGTDGQQDLRRLEYQANEFASHLLLPTNVLKRKTDEFKVILGLRDRGFGYIYVDDSPWNYGPFLELLGELSSYFAASRKAVEIKFLKLGWLNDQRRYSASGPNWLPSLPRAPNAKTSRDTSSE